MARSSTTSTPDQMVGGFLAKPGTYHLVITDIKDGESCKKEKMIDGMGISVKVLCGPEEGKTTAQDLLDGKESHSDGGTFCNARMTAFLIASNLVTPEQATGGDVSYDEQQARGQQLIATFEQSKDRDGNKTDFIEFKRFEIYHVDDPRVKDVAKDESSLAIIPDDLRRDEKYFEPLVAKVSKASSNGKKASPAKEPDFGGL